MSDVSGVVEWRIRLVLDDTLPDGWARPDWERTLQRAGDYYIGSLKSDNPTVASREAATSYLHREPELHALATRLVHWYDRTMAATLDSAYASVQITEFIVRLVGVWGEDIGTIDLLKGESQWIGSENYGGKP